MIKILSPQPNQVQQRTNNNTATVTVKGTTDSNNPVTITFTPRKNGVAKTVTVQPIANNFTATVEVVGGWYNLTATTATESDTIRFGVGEVIMIIGHSFSEKYGAKFAKYEEIIMPNSLYRQMENPDLYKQSGFLPMVEYKKENLLSFENDGQIEASFNDGIWGNLGNILVETYQVPVLFLNAGFGGTNLEIWYDVMYQIPFQHGFADYSKGMPYIKCKNMLQFIVPKTGLRTMLCLHGDNDNQNISQANIEKWYKGIISTIRKDAGIPDLSFVIALSISQKIPNWDQVINGALAIMNPNDDIYKGAEIYKYDESLRLPNGDIHLNDAGNLQAAKDFAQVIATKEFLLGTNPFSPGRNLSTITDKSTLTSTSNSNNIYKVLTWVFGFLFLVSLAKKSK